MEHSEISRATMGRLPGYLTYIRGLPQSTRYISATAIARELHLGEVQVRKDLSNVCGSGKPKVGYEIEALSDALESMLGSHADCEAIIIGAGKLGMALLGFGGFSEYGIRISKAFDCDPQKTTENVLPLADLSSYCLLHQVEIGVIAVPPEAAQSVADTLVKSGIKAIWCLAPIRLKVPANITVQYENMALSLAHLHQKVKNAHA